MNPAFPSLPLITLSHFRYELEAVIARIEAGAMDNDLRLVAAGLAMVFPQYVPIRKTDGKKTFERWRDTEVTEAYTVLISIQLGTIPDGAIAKLRRLLVHTPDEPVESSMPDTQEQRAITLALTEPGLTTTEIAKRVGADRTTLYKWPMFKMLREAQRELAKAQIPRGSKGKDGTIEAEHPDNR